MIPVNAAVTARSGIAGLKAVLDMLGYYGGPVQRLPLPISRRLQPSGCLMGILSREQT